MNTTTKKYEISESICKKSGLKFRWIEESIKGLDYRLELEIHPVFKKENFLKVEKELLGEKSYYDMDKVLASSLIMYRLMEWGVVQPKPSKEMLNAWVECMGRELSITEIKKYYRLVLENFKRENENGFKISLDGIVKIRDSLNENETREEKEKREERKGVRGVSSEIKQLCFLIGKCEEKHMELVEKGRRLGEIEEIEKIVEKDLIDRKLGIIDKEYLRQKALSAMNNLYRNINWTKDGNKDKEKGLKKKWKMASELVENDGLVLMGSYTQEKVLQFIEKGMQRSNKLPGKPEEYLRTYIAWIRAEEGTWKDEDEDEMR